MKEESIRARYFRKVIAYPEGAIVHDGDCHVWSAKICTCGLLHGLLPHTHDAAKIYPKYNDEIVDHLEALTTISNRDQ